MAQRLIDALVKPLVYRLFDPGFTIYHRAALGGLAATVRSWQRHPYNAPAGINSDLRPDQVTLTWDDDISNEEALGQILAASFKLTKENLIDLPGQGIDADLDGLRLAVHQGILGTFLQSKDARKVVTENSSLSLKNPDDESTEMLRYRGVATYFHQNAHRRFTLGGNDKDGVTAEIMQWMVPGAVKGAEALNAPLGEAFLLLFLMVGCGIFILRPRRYNKRKQDIQRNKFKFCLVVPDVTDLKRYAVALARISTAHKLIKGVRLDYLDRVVGGAEEAALRFLIDLDTQEKVTSEGRSVAGCIAIAMGKVAWDRQQINRSSMIKICQDYPEIEVFKVAKRHRNNKLIKVKSGENIAEVISPVPELVAANLTAQRHWCARFRNLIETKPEFKSMLFDMRGGMRDMSKAVKNEEDKAIIEVFQEAWNRTMGQMSGRANREGASSERSFETRAERIRNEILRAKNTDQMASWFLRFCANATKGKPMGALSDEATRRKVYNLIFAQRNFDRLQNLCLFALVSYASGEGKPITGGPK
jgi:CRISPR-associated protein Cas8a1/Csx13